MRQKEIVKPSLYILAHFHSAWFYSGMADMALSLRMAFWETKMPHIDHTHPPDRSKQTEKGVSKDAVTPLSQIQILPIGLNKSYLTKFTKVKSSMLRRVPYRRVHASACYRGLGKLGFDR